MTIDDVKEILLQITTRGILYARAWAFAGDAKKAGIEADHIHNLPELARDFRIELLDHYLRCQRNSYLYMLQTYSEKPDAELMEQWNQLESFLKDSNYVRQC
jgi:hypothetical protein